jgi:hypothetical protein
LIFIVSILFNTKGVLKNSFLCEDFGTGTQIVVGVVHVVPVDIHLAIVGIPVHVGNVAIGVARTRFIA